MDNKSLDVSKTNDPFGEERIIHKFYHVTSENYKEARGGELLANDYLEFEVVVEGGGVHCVEENTIPCKAGDVYIVPPGVRHGYFLVEPCGNLVIRKLCFYVEDWFHAEAATFNKLYSDFELNLNSTDEDDEMAEFFAERSF